MTVLTATKRLSHYLLILLAFVILSACSTTPSTPDNTPPTLFSTLPNNSAFYLEKAKQSDQQKSLPWQFAALQALISEKEILLADSITEYLNSQVLTEPQKNALNLLMASKFYAKNALDKTQQLLDLVKQKQLNEDGMLYFLKLQLKLQNDIDNYLGAYNTSLLLMPFLKTEAQKQHYSDLLLTQLSQLPIDFLEQYQSEQAISEKTNNADKLKIKQGWYALASLYQRYQTRPNQLLRLLADWHTRYPNHPATLMMPSQLKYLPKLSPYQPQNIAVLVPLSGRFKTQGHAIQYGVLSAYYDHKKSHKESHKENEKVVITPDIKFHFYDTQTQTMTQIINQLKKQKIDFVIGPLLKENIESFLPLAAKIPTLALNSFPKKAIDNTQNSDVETTIPWHYAFPLSPEEEAKQAANLIFANQHKNPLVIASNTAYGKRSSEAFSKQWSKINPDNQVPIESHFFNDKANLSNFINQVLHTDKSKRRISQMKIVSALALKTELRSRRDIDAIYIISKREELILLKPFIDVSISPFAASIPLYANSRSHRFDTSGKQNSGLSKLIFSDSPFLLETNNKAFTTMQKNLENKSFSTLRIFALGYDSYQLIGQLMQLQNNKMYTYQGLTGQLSLDQSNTLQAILSWAKYHRGKLIEVTTPITAK